MVSNETFFAWLDGELAHEEAAQVEAEVARDPELAPLAERHRAMQAKLKQAFDPITAAPLPSELLAAIERREPEVIDFAAAARSRQRRTWSPLPQWAAMAATLAVGIVAGMMIPERGLAPVEADGGKLYAAAALEQALDTQLASAPEGDVRIGITFRDQRGSICRSFTESAASGLACRAGGRWQLRGLFAAPEGQSGPYRMAAGPDPSLAALIDSTIAGEPFDAGQEKAARAKSWR